MAARSFALFALPALLAAQTPDAASLVAKVDRLRQPWPAFSADLAFQEKGREMVWRLSVASNGDSRLDGISPKQVQGRAVLMKGEGMWLLTPGSKRAIPVTPQQRLIGSAAGGDLARLKLGTDFQAEDIEEVSKDGVSCWRVGLEAKRSSVPYKRAELWMLKAGEVPRSVDFFFASGKLAQSIRFDAPTQVLGRALIAGMKMGDAAHPGQMAMKLSQWKPGEPGAALFEIPK
ncbi:MAG TPA: outer membrane lipoprotein-sorting protein [Holophagaceae bacterium]|jgi:hypothetical protein|nr:outer membrane lipoprotein-sorting protein [Holophagaceae bacterium]